MMKIPRTELRAIVGRTANQTTADFGLDIARRAYLLGVSHGKRIVPNRKTKPRKP